MTTQWAVRKRRGMWMLAAIVAAAAVAVPATRSLALDSSTAVGAVVTVDATGGDVRAFGASVTVNGAAANIRAAGADVEITAKAAGSLWAFAAKAGLGGSVGADATAAGNWLALTGQVGGDARLAGSVVTVDGSVGGNLRACAANLTIGPQATITGRLDVAGANVTMNGHVSGDARIAGAVVTFNGQADGAVVLIGDVVVVGPQAHIGRDLTVYTNKDPDISGTAVIGGTVNRVQPPAQLRALPFWAWGVGLAAAMVLGTIFAGIVLMLFGGRLFITALDYARLRPVSTILIGVITLILVPAIAILLSATVVGLPIGLALLFALPLLFVFGQPVAAAGIAAGIFVRTQGPVGIARALLFVILGSIIIALISLIPWVGALAVAIVVVLGVGALVRTAGGRLRIPGPRRVVVVDEPVPVPPRVVPFAVPPPPPPSPPPEPVPWQPEPDRPAS